MDSGRPRRLGGVPSLRGATMTYLRSPPPEPPTWSVGDPCRTPWPRTVEKKFVFERFAPTRDVTRGRLARLWSRACAEGVAESVKRAFGSVRARLANAR